MLGGVIDACARLPHRIDVFHWNGVGMEKVVSFQHVQFCSTYFVLATNGITTDAPDKLTVFSFEQDVLFFFFILLRFPLAGIEPRVG